MEEWKELWKNGGPARQKEINPPSTKGTPKPEKKILIGKRRKKETPKQNKKKEVSEKKVTVADMIKMIENKDTKKKEGRKIEPETKMQSMIRNWEEKTGEEDKEREKEEGKNREGLAGRKREVIRKSIKTTPSKLRKLMKTGPPEGGKNPSLEKRNKPRRGAYRASSKELEGTGKVMLNPKANVDGRGERGSEECQTRGDIPWERCGGFEGSSE